ncbi:MAG: S8 family serine peptidase [Bacteroidia bacterium]
MKPTAADTTKYGLAFSQIDMIKADCLNKKGFRGKGKQIAVIDTRFGMVDKLPAFDSLMKHKQILGTWDFVKEIPNVYNDSNNDTHGQLVLSCMASNLPGQLVGDAVDADYYLLRTEDIYSEYMIEDDNWASAAEYADSAGADIITTSLGYSVMQDQNNSYIYADMNGKTAVASIAATIAAEKGIVVCAAAGNDGSNHWHYICTPGDADSILTIGAVTATGDYANFSSKGPTYDGRIKPDVVARGSQVAVAGPYGGIISDEGTSFSAPTIAGAVAALWQADSTATNMQIINAIKQSASQYTHPDSLIGFGIPDFCKSLDILTKINGNKLGDETK